MVDNKYIDIVLVDDSEYDAEMAMIALKDNNVSNRIYWVKDGEEALNFLLAREDYEDRREEKQPKLILLDIKMPKVNGLQVLEELRNHQNTSHVPVVMLTSSKEEKDIFKAYELGVNSYIVKPIHFEEFSEAIGNIGHYWIHLNNSK